MLSRADETGKIVIKGKFRSAFSRKCARNRSCSSEMLFSGNTRVALVAYATSVLGSTVINTRQASSGLETCPGYSASNVVAKGDTLTADLSLAGKACNTFGEDLDNLKLFVQYETGKSRQHNR
jgi:hypothetical protein